PRERALDSPPSWKEFELRLEDDLLELVIGSDDEPAPGRALDHFHTPTQFLLDPVKPWASVGLVGPEVVQTGEALVQSGQHEPGPVSILNVGLMDDHFQEQPQRIPQQMALAPIALFAAIVAVWTAALGRLDGRTVDDRGTGGGLSSGLPAHLFA